MVASDFSQIFKQVGAVIRKDVDARFSQRDAEIANLKTENKALLSRLDRIEGGLITRALDLSAQTPPPKAKAPAKPRAAKAKTASKPKAPGPVKVSKTPKTPRKAVKVRTTTATAVKLYRQGFLRAAEQKEGRHPMTQSPYVTQAELDKFADGAGKMTFDYVSKKLADRDREIQDLRDRLFRLESAMITGAAQPQPAKTAAPKPASIPRKATATKKPAAKQPEKHRVVKADPPKKKPVKVTPAKTRVVKKTPPRTRVVKTDAKKKAAAAKARG